MNMILSEKARSGRARVLAGPLPTHIEWTAGKGLPVIYFDDGSAGHSACVRCPDAPCISYAEVELRTNALPDYPADAVASVCPTSAIHWPREMPAPVIQPELCIACGLCVARCPVRAIGLTTEGAFVHDGNDKHWQELESPATKESADEQARAFHDVPEEGSLLRESDVELAHLRCRVNDSAKRLGAEFTNLLVRNLLIATGVGAAMRRCGDQSVRMDMVLGPPGVDLGVAEVELGSAVIDTPRYILDDIAVLVSRYGIARASIVPVIVTGALPNARTEYWRVLKDIRQVLDIHIASLTIGVLAIANWSRATITLSEAGSYYVDVDSPNLRPYLECDLGRLLACGEGYAGCFESGK